MCIFWCVGKQRKGHQRMSVFHHVRIVWFPGWETCCIWCVYADLSFFPTQVPWHWSAFAGPTLYNVVVMNSWNHCLRTTSTITWKLSETFLNSRLRVLATVPISWEHMALGEESGPWKKCPSATPKNRLLSTDDNDNFVEFNDHWRPSLLDSDGVWAALSDLICWS